MAMKEELIYAGENHSMSFGNHLLKEKHKWDGFEFDGDEYKVKTYQEMTKLEKNGKMVYESVPGTSVTDFVSSIEETAFTVRGLKDVQITLEMEPEKAYGVFVNGGEAGIIKTNVSGKLSMGVSLDDGQSTEIRIKTMAE